MRAVDGTNYIKCKNNKAPLALPCGDPALIVVWVCVGEGAMALRFLSPVFVPRVGVGHKIVVLGGAVVRPDAAERAEIGIPALGIQAGRAWHLGDGRQPEISMCQLPGTHDFKQSVPVVGVDLRETPPATGVDSTDLRYVYEAKSIQFGYTPRQSWQDYLGASE